MKKCCKCKIEKDTSEFYINLRLKSGYSSDCKECNKAYERQRYLRRIKEDGFIDKQRKRGIEKYKRLYSKALQPYIHKYTDGTTWATRYPEKQKAKNISYGMRKPFEGAEKHHWSYNKEHYKDVIWLTKKHHVVSHRFIIYDQERMMYRRYDNNLLLDTKESHEEFIKNCIKTNYE